MLVVYYCLIHIYVTPLKTKLTRLDAEFEQLRDHAWVTQEKRLMALTEGEDQSQILDTARHIRRYLLYLYQVVLFIFRKSYRFPLFNPPTYNTTHHRAQEFNITRLQSTLQHMLALLYTVFLIFILTSTFVNNWEHLSYEVTLDSRC